MRSFIQKGILILLLATVSILHLRGATTITILGPRDVCKNSTTSYTIEATNAKGVIIDITGGGSFVISSISLSGSSCPSTAVFEDNPAPTSTLFEIQDAGLNTCSKLVATFNVSWGTSGGTLSALAVKPNNGTTTKSIDVDAEPLPVIVGPAGEICSSTSSVSYYVTEVPALQTVTWTTTSTFGAPISPSTTTGIYATFSGLTSGNMYSINAEYQCPGSSVRSRGTFIVTSLSCRISRENFEVKSANQSLNIFDAPISNIREQNSIKVYPNPVTSNSVVMVELLEKFSTQGSITANIFDSDGKLLKTLQTDKEKFSFQTQNFGTGTYYLIITSGEKTETKRFIISE